MRKVRRMRPHLIEQRADRGYDGEIGALAVAADIVAFAGAAPRQHGVERAGVILDMQPVAHVVALAVDRNRLAVQRLQDRERDQLLGEVIGAVIVRAVAQHCRQAERFVPGAHEMVRGCFRRGIRGIGLVAAVFAEPAVGPERAEHLVGRDVVKAEPRRAVGRHSAPIIERGFQQRVGALDIRPDELAGAVDRAVDMQLGREMQDRVGCEVLQQLGDQLAVENIAAAKAISRIVGDRFQRGRIGGVGQLVQIENRVTQLADEQPAHGRTDKSGAAGNQNFHRCWLSVRATAGINRCLPSAR